ncbi:hypothetical protein ABIE26_001683 [Pedobacter africanus]|uniref:Uncharacterized protein n=1 Tax=Pedobacter africanus TaxID=151894 RepID=A0ACC6KRP6_9SPHI|nr:hypothetical protein [Pedobacter africanus]MDR6781829.1 hypothetical protein [Pedobacter africanus]
MKTLTLKSYTLKLAALFLGVVLFASCSKDKKDGPGGYPKNVNIEYRVTSVANVTFGDVDYTNETGSSATIDDAALPFSKKITKKVEAGDVIRLSFYTSTPGSVKLELLVDGKVVDSKTPSSTSSIYEVVSYGFQ